MSHLPSSSEECYATVVEALQSTSDVSRTSESPRGRFGSSGQLKVHNKIFAMLVRGRLVVKIPRDRVDTLVAEGHGERFDPGHGRLMKEWIAIELESTENWLSLAREAMEFVATKR